jgi:hypothetical protein
MNNLELSVCLDSLLLVTSPLPTAEALRMVLLPGELFRVPDRKRALRVLSGTAWVSFAGMDHAVRGNESLDLRRAKDCVLVSEADGQPLVVEIV